MSVASAKTFVGIWLVAFLAVSFLGVADVDMTLGSGGQMSSRDCFMPGMTEVLCQMNPLEHIAAWQSMFTAAPSQNHIFLLLVFLLTFTLGALFAVYRSIAPPEIRISSSQFLYSKRHIPIVIPLQEAFSNGILHPKIF